MSDPFSHQRQYDTVVPGNHLMQETFPLRASVGDSFLEIQATFAFVISLAMAWLQKRVPVRSSISSASSTDLGTRIPNLRVVLQYRAFTFHVILSRSLSTLWTHQLNAGL